MVSLRVSFCDRASHAASLAEHSHELFALCLTLALNPICIYASASILIRDGVIRHSVFQVHCTNLSPPHGRPHGSCPMVPNLIPTSQDGESRCLATLLSSKCRSDVECGFSVHALVHQSHLRRDGTPDEICIAAMQLLSPLLLAQKPISNPSCFPFAPLSYINSAAPMRAFREFTSPFIFPHSVIHSVIHSLSNHL